MTNLLTPTDVYKQLVQYMYLASGSIRKANIFAVKYTWKYFNNQHELNKLMLHAAKELT